MLSRVPRRFTEEAIAFVSRAYDSTAAAVGSLDDGTGNAKTHRNSRRSEQTMPRQKPDRGLSPMPHQNQGGLLGTRSMSGLAQSTSMSSDMHVLTAMFDQTHRSSLLAGTAAATSVRSNGMERSTHAVGRYVFPPSFFAKSLVDLYPTDGFYRSNKAISGSGVCVNFLRAHSTSAEVRPPLEAEAVQKDADDAKKALVKPIEVEEEANKGKEGTIQEDAFTQMLEMMGILMDGDISTAADELRQAQQEMLVRMRRCSRVLFAVAAVHLTWGGMMFCALESPLNHAVVTEVCMTSLVIGALAYQLKQTTKPIELLTSRKERRKVRIIYASRQVSRMLGAFFHRGYGIAFVLSLSLTAHAVSCMRFLL